MYTMSMKLLLHSATKPSVGANNSTVHISLLVPSISHEISQNSFGGKVLDTHYISVVICVHYIQFLKLPYLE
jgi:hypothetical protein